MLGYQRGHGKARLLHGVHSSNSAGGREEIDELTREIGTAARADENGRVDWL